MISNEDRYCPIADKEISRDVCYEVVMCFYGGFRSDSVTEFQFKKDAETKKICDECEYSHWDD